MIPRLYDASATSFDDLGIGALSDAISCVVEEERNGLYELTMEYPIGGAHYDDIVLDAIITAVPSDGADTQPFRIYAITKPISGIVTINAHHISYQLSNIPVMPFSASSVADAFTKLATYAAEDCPFEFWTDKTTTASFSVDYPESIRAKLGGQSGSILDAYGGEYEFDGYTVKLHASRGSDRGVTLRYGKHLRQR